LPAVLAARQSLNAVAPHQRKKRARDPREVEFVAALKECFRKIAGRNPGVTRNVQDDEYSGDFLKLVRDIDAVYRTEIAIRKKPTKLLRQ
jgi:hypothetical protein